MAERGYDPDKALAGMNFDDFVNEAVSNNSASEPPADADPGTPPPDVDADKKAREYQTKFDALISQRTTTLTNFNLKLSQARTYTDLDRVADLARNYQNLCNDTIFLMQSTGQPNNLIQEERDSLAKYLAKFDSEIRTAQTRIEAAERAGGPSGETPEQKKRREADARRQEIYVEKNKTWDEFFRSYRDLSEGNVAELKRLRNKYKALLEEDIVILKANSFPLFVIEDAELAMKENCEALDNRMETYAGYLKDEQGRLARDPEGLEKIRETFARIELYESYIKQILGRKDTTEDAKTAFKDRFNDVKNAITEADALNLTERDKERLAGYKQALADYKVQAIVRGILGAEDLAEARGAIVIAQKRVESAQRIGHGLLKFVGGKSRGQVNKELVAAQAEYERLVKEAAFTDRAMILAEKSKLADARLEAYTKDRGRLHKLVDWNKRLSGFSAERLVSQEWKDKHTWMTKGLKMINGRTVVSAGLLGASTALTFGGNVALGLGLGAARAGWSFVGSGLGTYGMMTGLREGWKNRVAGKEIETMDAEKVEENISSIQARAALDGRELKDNPLYAQLLAKREKFAAEKSAVTPEEMETELKKLFGPVDDGFIKQIKKERRFEMIAAGTSIAAASISAGWILRRAQNTYELARPDMSQSPSPGHGWLFDKLKEGEITPKTPPLQEPFETAIKGTELKSPVVESMHPETTPVGTGLPGAVENATVPGGAIPGAGAEAVPSGPGLAGNIVEAPKPGAGTVVKHVELRAGASVDVGSAGDAVVSAGERGIEGAFLDLKTQDSARFEQAVKWLQEHYKQPEGKPENLIHKFILDNSEGKDLNRILSGDLRIGANGEITLGDVKFMPAVEQAADAGADATPRVGGYTGPAAEIPPPSGAGVAGAAESIPTGEAVEPLDSTSIEGYASDHFNPSLGDDNFERSTSNILARQAAKDMAAETILSPEKAAGKVEKLSDAMQLMLGREESSAFLKTLGFKSVEALNNIQNHTFAWLVKEKATNPFNANKFDVLIDTIKELKETKGWSWNAVNSMSLKKVFIELAKEARK